MARQLIIFVKSPYIGFVKTRLARHIGKLEAQRFYRQTSEQLLLRLNRLHNTTIHLGVTPGKDAFGTSPWPSQYRRFPQSAGDIGRRMTAAFHQIPAGPTVLIGSDIPAITTDHIELAFRALRKNDIVFGPAQDGGFWLLGLKHPHLPKRLFKKVRWSSENTLEDVMRGLPPHLKVGIVDRLRDVDEIADWRAYHEAAASCSRNRGINSAKLQGL